MCKFMRNRSLGEGRGGLEQMEERKPLENLLILLLVENIFCYL